MAPQIPVPSSYRIEVSGWDADERFFVERTNLDWSEENDRKVYLRHLLRERAVIFVRLIAPMGSAHTFPIAYRAEYVAAASTQGTWEIHLVQLHHGNDSHARSRRKSACTR